MKRLSFAMKQRQTTETVTVKSRLVFRQHEFMNGKVEQSRKQIARKLTSSRIAPHRHSPSHVADYKLWRSLMHTRLHVKINTKPYHNHHKRCTMHTTHYTTNTIKAHCTATLLQTSAHGNVMKKLEFEVVSQTLES